MKPTRRDMERAREIMRAARVLKSDAVSDIARALAEVRRETWLAASSAIGRVVAEHPDWSTKRHEIMALVNAALRERAWKP